MAKREQEKKTFSLQGFDANHYKRTEQYVKVVTNLYNRAIAEIADHAAKGTYNPEKPFMFNDYPKTKKYVQEVTSKLSSNIKVVIETGAKQEWLYACKKNDEFLNSIINTSKLTKEALEQYQDRNLDALKTFQSRKVDGMDLSKRVWRYTEQFKDQIEQGLDVGLGEGRSAQQLSRDLRQNLVEPERLYRRVRDKRGNLQLSKNAKAFNPGQGIYRSSAKNAMRLTRSEINMAYRESDWLRWQQLDFVVGFEIKVSNRHLEWLEKVWNKQNPGKIEICDQLAGKYQKWFKFVGWHPQCMCYVTPIIEDFYSKDRSDDRVNRLRSALNGTEYKKYVSKQTVTDMPDGFKEWVTNNAEKQLNWKSVPYFIRDNFKGGIIVKGLKYSPTKAVPIKPVISSYSDNMPEQFKPKSAYLRGEDYKFDKKFFDLVDKNNPVKLKISKSGGSYYDPSAKAVNIADTDRNDKSAWERKAVVYHEFGHAIDWQRGLRNSKQVADLRETQIKNLKKKSDYKVWLRKMNYDKMEYELTSMNIRTSRVDYIDYRLKDLSAKVWRMDDATFTKRGITKMDVIEQIMSTRDTIKSLVVKYGDGHSTLYFSRPGTKEAEYLAHAFENAYIGNEVFKKYLPDIYEEMISYIRSLK